MWEKNFLFGILHKMEKKLFKKILIFLLLF